MAENQTSARAWPAAPSAALVALALLAVARAGRGGRDHQGQARRRQGRVRAAQAGDRGPAAGPGPALEAQAAVIAEAMDEAQGRWEQITDELRTTTLRARATAQAKYQGLQDQLESRAREAYITGPGSSLEFLLGRDVARGPVGPDGVRERAQPGGRRPRERGPEPPERPRRPSRTSRRSSRRRPRRPCTKVEVEKAALDAKFAEQQGVMDDLNAKKARAEELVQDLEKQYKQELAALYGPARSTRTASCRCARSTSRAPCTTGSARPGTRAATTRTPATTSSPRRGRRSAPRSTATRTPRSNTLGGYAEYVLRAPTATSTTRT